MKRSTIIALSVLGVALAIFGGSKRGTVTFPQTGEFRYITDTGSYVTNDWVHVSFRAVVVPAAAPLVVLYRELSSTNIEDWTEYEIDPPWTVGDSPFDVTMACATNYNWQVFADWTPGPSVETNGVWHAFGSRDRKTGEHYLLLRSAIRIDSDVIATPKSKRDHTNE